MRGAAKRCPVFTLHCQPYKMAGNSLEMARFEHQLCSTLLLELSHKLFHLLQKRRSYRTVHDFLHFCGAQKGWFSPIPAWKNCETCSVSPAFLWTRFLRRGLGGTRKTTPPRQLSVENWSFFSPKLFWHQKCTFKTGHRPVWSHADSDQRLTPSLRIWLLSATVRLIW